MPVPTLEQLIDCLNRREGEGVEFKPHTLGRKELAEYAVGIGNSGGGWLFMGVSDRIPRRILPFTWPTDSELLNIRQSIYDAARIRVDFSRLDHPDGPVLAMTIPPRPRGAWFHTQDGKHLIRLDEGLRGMSLAEMDAIRREAGVELSAEPVPGDWRTLVRPAGLEVLRDLMREMQAAPDIAALPDADLLRTLGLLTDDGFLRVAGLVLVGHTEPLRQHLPHSHWSFFRMRSDTDYEQAERGHDCFTIALRRLRELIGAHNPIVTLPGQLVHAEFPRYPLVALRELLVNALVHRDYTTPGGVVAKLYPDRLELSNPGGFLADITPANILHHPSTPRYPALFQALTVARLANAANLGVRRAFRDLLVEGKEPPYYHATGQSIVVTIKAQEAGRAFIEMVNGHPDLAVDDLLVIHFLTRHREINVAQAAEICQRPTEAARELLARLANHARLIESGGPTGRGRYFRLTSSAYAALGTEPDYDRDARLSQENLKARVLTTLQRRSLSNADIRQITQLDRNQAKRLMEALRQEKLVHTTGAGRGARWLPTAQPQMGDAPKQ